MYFSLNLGHVKKLSFSRSEWVYISFTEKKNFLKFGLIEVIYKIRLDFQVM